MEKGKNLYLGVVADDFTGAGDAASFLRAAGLNTLLLSGVPRAEMEEECDAVVIALKSRSAPVSQAVSESLEAFRWMERAGAQKLYFKYCSTFDSTPAGNIGPVADRMLEELGQPYTLLCPALPVNGRTVREGVLYVKGVPLAQSPMKDHPLNPMWASEIPSLMAPQSAYPCRAVSRREWQEGQLEDILAECRKQADHFYLVPDQETEEDARGLMARFGGLRFLTGGSGLMEAIAADCPRTGAGSVPAQGAQGPAILLSGSCSRATQRQILRYRQEHPSCALWAEKLLDGRQSYEELWAFYQEHQEQAPLFYSAGASEPLMQGEEESRRDRWAAAVLERTLARLAQDALTQGARRLIVAGGETSGAVARQLGFEGYRIGDSVAPGVPVMVPLGSPQVRVVYKSGNFGEADFFEKALAMTGPAGEK